MYPGEEIQSWLGTSSIFEGSDAPDNTTNVLRNLFGFTEASGSMEGSCRTQPAPGADTRGEPSIRRVVLPRVWIRNREGRGGVDFMAAIFGK